MLAGHKRLGTLITAMIAIAVASSVLFAGRGATASTTTPPDASMLGVFTVVASAQDRLPLRYLNIASHVPGTLNVNQARRIEADASGDGVWAVPGTDPSGASVICTFAPGGGGCITPAELASRQVATQTIGGTPDGPSTDPGHGRVVVVGLAADNVASVTVKMADGSDAVVPVQRNGFIYNAKGSPTELTWQASGATHATAVAAP